MPASSCACPPTWRASRPPRPQVTGTVGARAPSALGLEGVLDFRMAVTLDGETLSAAGDRVVARRHRLAWCCCAASGSRSIANGSSARCSSSARPSNWRQREGLTFAEAMRMLAGAAVADEPARSRRRRLVARDGRALAGGDAAKAARAGRRGRRSRPGAARHAAAVSARRRAVAASAVRARAGRVPRRRHGAGQDDPGAGAAAGATAATASRASRACWWRRRRCWPTGRRRSRSCARPEGGDRASLGDDRRADQASSRRNTRRSSIWRSPATARCCASRRWRRSSGASPSWTRRRRSRTRTPSRRGRPRR